MKEKKGISLIVLIVTIIVMIIIAGAIIISLTETNIIDQADSATKKWNIATIKEQINVENALRQGGIEGEYLDKVDNGTLKELGITETGYDDKLLIQNGTLVYRPEMITQEEIEDFTSRGINAGTYVGVVASVESLVNYKNTTNLITADNLEATIVGNTEAVIYILEDISLPSDYGNNGLHKFYGVIDGMGHKVTFNSPPPFIPVNYGIIKNVILKGTEYGLIGGGMFGYDNYGTIYNCHNELILQDGQIVAGIVNKNEGKIVNCSNRADMVGYDQLAGISLENYGEIHNCYNSGNIEIYGAAEPAAGIALYSRGKIKNCYNAGNITGNGHASGIIFSSFNENNVSKSQNCYNLGSITTDGNNFGIGGDEINNCYSKDTNLALVAIDTLSVSSDWIENLGATDAEQKAELLKRINVGNSTSVWIEDTNNINNGYPILYWQAEN